jgi:hypothetical protein
LQCISCHRQKRRAQTLLAARKRVPKIPDNNEDDPLGVEEERDEDSELEVEEDDDDDDVDVDADADADTDDAVTAKGISLDDIADSAGLVSKTHLAVSIYLLT